jgi:hypothetical protein
MVAFRILVALLIVIVGASLVVAFITKDARWKRFALQTLRVGIIILLIFLALYALERLLLVV